MAMTRSTLNLGRDIYMDVITDAGEGADRSYEYCLNVFSTTQDHEDFKLIDAFGYASPTNEGAAYLTEDRSELYTAAFYWQKYTHGYGWTEEAKYTDQFNKLEESGRLVVEAIEDTRAKSCSDMFNNGFNTTSYAGIDTVSLFHTTHPTNGGTTWSNRPSTDIALSANAFGQAIQEMMQVKDSKNRPVRSTPKGVVLRVPAALYMTAKTIEATTRGRPGTADNDAAVQREFLNSIFMDQQLTSTTAWFLTDADKSRLGLKLMTGLPRETTMDPQPGYGKAFFYTRDSWVAFWTHARHTWGTTGA